MLSDDVNHNMPRLNSTAARHIKWWARTCKLQRDVLYVYICTEPTTACNATFGHRLRFTIFSTRFDIVVFFVLLNFCRILVANQMLLDDTHSHYAFDRWTMPLNIALFGAMNRRCETIDISIGKYRATCNYNDTFSIFPYQIPLYCFILNHHKVLLNSTWLGKHRLLIVV